MPTTPSRPAAPAGRPTAHSRHHLCQSATAATNAAVLLNGRPSLRSQFLTETARTRCQWQSRAACASRLQAPAVSTWTNDLQPSYRTEARCCHSGVTHDSVAIAHNAMASTTVCPQPQNVHMHAAQAAVRAVLEAHQRRHLQVGHGPPTSSGGASSGVAFFGVAPFFFAQWVRANFLSTGSSRCTRPPVHCTAGTAARRRRWSSLPVCWRRRSPVAPDSLALRHRRPCTRSAAHAYCTQRPSRPRCCCC